MAWKTKVLNLITEGNIPVEVEKTNQKKIYAGDDVAK